MGPGAGRPRASRRSSVGLIAGILAFGLLGLGVRAVPALLEEDLVDLVAVPAAATPSPAVAPPAPSTGAETTESPAPASPPKPTKPVQVKKQSAEVTVPDTGPGTYTTARQSVDAPSTSGRLIRYDVRVEDTLDIEPAAAAKQIASVLSDQRSWRGTGRWRFELVPAGEQAELHAYLVTPGTTDRLCAPLLTRGEVSCQSGNKVVLNAKRWVLGADAYGADVTNYRRYLVNHEFGHYLGYQHVQCPGSGRSAPVMMQQTKGLGGCRKNPWPRSTGD
ncbi:MAG TPA: DUF3152 domain-containing protein [Propionibacteriaceae bacterium]|nr:DUF3152 domain-containing protein [Propionibacteriaceae bacterium]